MYTIEKLLMRMYINLGTWQKHYSYIKDVTNYTICCFVIITTVVNKSCAGLCIECGRLHHLCGAFTQLDLESECG